MLDMCQPTDGVHLPDQPTYDEVCWPTAYLRWTGVSLQMKCAGLVSLLKKKLTGLQSTNAGQVLA